MSNAFSRTLWWLLVITCCSQLFIMWALPYADTSEPRYAAIAQLMAQTHDWVTPWFSPGVPFWGKPPLSFWAQALSFSAFGYNEFAGRLPSWIANLIITVLIVQSARLLSHQGHTTREAHSSVPLLAALLYNTMCLSFSSAGAVLTDPYLNLGLTLSMVSLLQQSQQRSVVWGWGFFVGLSIGMLAKGPLAIIFSFAPIALLFCFKKNKTVELLKSLPWLSGLLIFCLLSLPWYFAAELKTPGFLDYFLIGEHIKRFLIPGWQGDLYGTAHKAALGSIWLSVLPATLPWGVVAIVLLLRGWKKKGLTGLRQLPVAHLYLLICALFPAIFFSVSRNVLWTYLLPGLAPCALLTAYYYPTAKLAMQRLVIACALLMPLAGLTLAGLGLHDVTMIKTDRPLVDAFLRHAEPNDVLYFADDPTFSARFYSQERTASLKNLPNQEQVDGIRFIVISNDDTQTLETLTKKQYRTLAYSKRHQLMMR